MQDQRSDEQLVVTYRDNRDEKALRELIERYALILRAFIYRYVGTVENAEDITQDVFISAWKHLKRFDETKRFKTWIFTIAKNASLNWVKKKRPALFSAFENDIGKNTLEETLVDASPLPDARMEAIEKRGELNNVIARIAPIYRTVLAMYYEDHLTFQEIADSLDESVNTVKSRHRRALAKLKKLM